MPTLFSRIESDPESVAESESESVTESATESVAVTESVTETVPATETATETVPAQPLGVGGGTERSERDDAISSISYSSVRPSRSLEGTSRAAASCLM